MTVVIDTNVFVSLAAKRLTRRSEKYDGLKWHSFYGWVQSKAVYFEPIPLGKQRSRDASNDIFIACALAANAKTIVSYDKDLLDLKKPFGIEILKPNIFISKF
jgi:predicted nucleic acid-binding protein